MTKYMVIWKDGDGIPRAWGQSFNEEQAEAEADAQLVEYRKGRPELTGWKCIIKTVDYREESFSVIGEKERA